MNSERKDKRMAIVSVLLPLLAYAVVVVVFILPLFYPGWEAPLLKGWLMFIVFFPASIAGLVLGIRYRSSAIAIVGIALSSIILLCFLGFLLLTIANFG